MPTKTPVPEGNRATATVDVKTLQDDDEIPPTMRLQGSRKFLPVNVTKLPGYVMEGKILWSTVRYEGRSHEVTIFAGVIHLKVIVSASDVPFPPAGMVTCMVEKDTRLNEDTEKVPIATFTLDDKQVVKLEPDTVILSPGDRTSGKTFEMVCPEMRQNSDKRQRSAVKDARGNIMTSRYASLRVTCVAWPVSKPFNELWCLLLLQAPAIRNRSSSNKLSSLEHPHQLL